MSNIGRKQPLSPAGHPVRLGQESSGQELLVRGHLSVHYVFRQDMFAAGVGVKVTLRSLTLGDGTGVRGHMTSSVSIPDAEVASETRQPHGVN